MQGWERFHDDADARYPVREIDECIPDRSFPDDLLGHWTSGIVGRVGDLGDDESVLPTSGLSTVP